MGGQLHLWFKQACSCQAGNPSFLCCCFLVLTRIGASPLDAGNNGAVWKRWPWRVNIHYLIRHGAQLSDLEKVAVKKENKTKQKNRFFQFCLWKVRGKGQNGLKNPTATVSKGGTTAASPLHDRWCCPMALLSRIPGMAPVHGSAFMVGRQKVTNVLLELLHDLFCLGLLKMKLEERSRHEKIRSFL